MEKHEVKAVTMITEINRMLCRTCTIDKVAIEIAIWQCKEFDYWQEKAKEMTNKYNDLINKQK